MSSLVYEHAFLLVNVSLHDFHAVLQSSHLFFVLYYLIVVLRDLLQVANHVVEDVNLITNEFLVLLDEPLQLILHSVNLLFIHTVLYLCFYFFFDSDYFNEFAVAFEYLHNVAVYQFSKHP